MSRARLLLCVSFLGLSGCATRQVVLEVDPPDAEVLEGGRRVEGKSPFEFELDYNVRDPSTGAYLPRRVTVRQPDHEGVDLDIPLAKEPFRRKVSLRMISKRMPLIELDPLTHEISTRYVTAMLDTIETSSAVRGASQITNYTETDCAEPALNQVERIDASPTAGQVVYALSYRRGHFLMIKAVKPKA